MLTLLVFTETVCIRELFVLWLRSFLWPRAGLWVLLVELEGFFDQAVHKVCIESKFLLNVVRLSLLAREGVANQADLQAEPVRCLWVLRDRSLLTVALNDFLDCVAQQEVVFGLGADFKVTFFKLDLIIGLSFSGSFLAGRNLLRWVQDRLQVDV